MEDKNKTLKKGRREPPLKEKEDLTFEPCILGKAKVWLPVNLFEDPSVFRSVVSQKTWNAVLSDDERTRLLELMPTFPENDEEEKMETLRRLFEGQNFKFGNPGTNLREKLWAGYMNPEIVRMEKDFRRAKYQDYKYHQQRRLHKLLKEVLISRQELLEAAIFTSPSEPIAVKRRPFQNDKIIDGVVEKKYRRLLGARKEEDGHQDSSDEAERVTDHNGFQNGSCPSAEVKESDDESGPKWTDMWPTEFELQDETQTHSTFDPKPTAGETNAGGKVTSPTKSTVPIRITERHYIDMLERYQYRTDDDHLQNHPDLDTHDINMTDVISRAFPLPPPPVSTPGLVAGINDSPLKMKKRKDKDRDKKKRKKKKFMVAPPKSTTPVSTGSVDAVSPGDILSTPESRLSNREDLSVSPATCSPASAGSQSSDIKPPLRVHPSFFSLLRDVFTAAPNHRLTLAKLQESLANWQCSPVSMLSTWAMLQPSWAKVVDGAMKFLNGEIEVTPEVIPRVRYDDDRQMWQWRSELPPDSEEELVTLFKQWLDTLPGMRAVPAEPKESPTSPPSSPNVAAGQMPSPSHADVKFNFAEQERERYSQPHKAFVYKMPGYEAIVGPVKGVFGKETTLNKAREHSLLISDRPPYVTILSLVRDAVARLPNGEGTRATVCELLKDSQFLAESSDSQINNVVSGALDRLHYEKDPCVKYDVNRKLWIYLHRSRTKEQFEKIHLEQAAVVKARKTIARQTKILPKMMKPGSRDSPISLPTSRPGSAMSDTSSESLSIEVVSPRASPGSASSPKPSRKSPAVVKSTSLHSSLGIGFGFGIGSDSTTPTTVNAASKLAQQVSSSPLAMTVSSGGSKVMSGALLGQAPFVISPQKVGSFQSAIRGLHRNPGIVSVSSSDSFIKAQLLAAKATQNTSAASKLPFSQQQGIITMASQGGMAGMRDTVSKGLAGGILQSDSQFDALRHMPALMKSLSVPCTLPDGKVVMVTPEIMAMPRKATKKRSRTSSGGKGGMHIPQVSDLNISTAGQPDVSKVTGASSVTPGLMNINQGVTKGAVGVRKGTSGSPCPVTLGASKLATVSEALAQKRAEAALQSGKQQPRGPSTITLPPGALKGQTVKSILASVGIPLSGTSVTVSRIDTQSAPTASKQGTVKSKDNRKSPIISGVSLIGSPHTSKPRPSSAPTISGKKSPIISASAGRPHAMSKDAQHAISHQTIGLTTVTKGGQIVVQPMSVGMDRPVSASAGGSATSHAGQALTIRAIPMSVAKQQADHRSIHGGEQQDRLPGERKVVNVCRGADEPDGATVAKKAKLSAAGRSTTPGQAAAMLAHMRKAAGGIDPGKDMTSVPLSVLLPGARHGSVTGLHKGTLLASPILAGGQIPLASLTEGKGVIFQVPPGSNFMSLPVTGVGTSAKSAGMTATVSSSPLCATTISTRSHPSSRTPPKVVKSQHLQIPLSLPTVSLSPTKSSLLSQQLRTTPATRHPNFSMATIKSTLAAAQSNIGLSSSTLSSPSITSAIPHPVNLSTHLTSSPASTSSVFTSALHRVISSMKQNPSATSTTGISQLTAAQLATHLVAQSRASSLTTSSSTTSATLTSMPGRTIPAFEPRITRGQTKEKDKTTKKDSLQ